jgi:hypothetical protein
VKAKANAWLGLKYLPISFFFIIFIASLTPACLASASGKLRFNRMRTDVGLAEMASCQMEFKYLAYLTHNSTYFHQSDKIMDILEKAQGKTPKQIFKTDAVGKTIQAMSYDHDDEDWNTGLWTNRWYIEDARMFGSECLV